MVSPAEEAVRVGGKDSTSWAVSKDGNAAPRTRWRTIDVVRRDGDTLNDDPEAAEEAGHLHSHRAAAVGPHAHEPTKR